jgi:hypothetical protein
LVYQLWECESAHSAQNQMVIAKILQGKQSCINRITRFFGV